VLVYRLHIKNKAVSLTGRGGLCSCEMLKIPRCPDNRLTDGVEVARLTHRPHSTPYKYYGIIPSYTHFCLRMSRLRASAFFPFFVFVSSPSGAVAVLAGRAQRLSHRSQAPICMIHAPQQQVTHFSASALRNFLFNYLHSESRANRRANTSFAVPSNSLAVFVQLINTK
jgi:hypothetical protein